MCCNNYENINYVTNRLKSEYGKFLSVREAVVVVLLLLLFAAVRVQLVFFVDFSIST